MFTDTTTILYLLEVQKIEPYGIYESRTSSDESR